MVNNIVITLYGYDGNQIYDWDHIVIYINIQSPETSRILCVNYILIKKLKIRTL